MYVDFSYLFLVARDTMGIHPRTQYKIYNLFAIVISRQLFIFTNKSCLSAENANWHLVYILQVQTLYFSININEVIKKKYAKEINGEIGLQNK
jgi:hypothetical protein